MPFTLSYHLCWSQWLPLSPEEPKPWRMFSSQTELGAHVCSPSESGKGVPQGAHRDCHVCSFLPSLDKRIPAFLCWSGSVTPGGWWLPICLLALGPREYRGTGIARYVFWRGTLVALDTLLNRAQSWRNGKPKVPQWVTGNNVRWNHSCFHLLIHLPTDFSCGGCSATSTPPIQCVYWVLENGTAALPHLSSELAFQAYFSRQSYYSVMASCILNGTACNATGASYGYEPTPPPPSCEMKHPGQMLCFMQSGIL